jgi:predicted Zn finger-like uncharacterized protein
MAIEFTCPACGGALRVRDAAIGQVVRCGGCLTMLRVPNTAAASPVPPRDEPEPPPRPNSSPAATGPEPDFLDPTQAPSRPVAASTRFWLTVTATTLVLGACGCCGLAALILPDPEWREHDSPAGGFRVELPAEPRRDTERRFRDVGLRFERMKAVEGTHLWTRAENYAIAHRDLAPGRLATDDQVLDAQIKDLLRGEVRQTGQTTRIEVDGFPGREFSCQTGNGSVYTGRVVLAGTRVYVLLAGGRFAESDDGNVRHFLESFEITDPRLLAEAKRRADAAALGEEQLRQRVARDRLRELGEIAAVTALEAATGQKE